MKKYLTRAEVAEYLHVCLSTADKIINNKNFDGKLKLGRRVLIDKAKLDMFMENYVV